MWDVNRASRLSMRELSAAISVRTSWWVALCRESTFWRMALKRLSIASQRARPTPEARAQLQPKLVPQSRHL